MTRKDIVASILRILGDFAAARGEALDPTEETPLVGERAVVDSIGLVTVLMDLEQELNDVLPRPVALADDRALSQTRSPFRTVGSLADYAALLAAEKGESS
jgi:acyl carrier protein